MLQNKSIKRLYGVMATLMLLALGACSDENEPVIIEDNPMELLRGSWTMTTAGYGLSSASTGTNTIVFGTTDNATMTNAETGSGATAYSTATGTYSMSGDNILKVQWNAMTIDGESDNAFNTFYMMGEVKITGASMQWDYSIYDNSTSSVLAGPFTARFAKSNN